MLVAPVVFAQPEPLESVFLLHSYQSLCYGVFVLGIGGTEYAEGKTCQSHAVELHFVGTLNVFAAQ